MDEVSRLWVKNLPFHTKDFLEKYILWLRSFSFIRDKEDRFLKRKYRLNKLFVFQKKSFLQVLSITFFSYLTINRFSLVVWRDENSFRLDFSNERQLFFTTWKEGEVPLQMTWIKKGRNSQSYWSEKSW